MRKETVSSLVCRLVCIAYSTIFLNSSLIRPDFDKNSLFKEELDATPLFFQYSSHTVYPTRFWRTWHVFLLTPPPVLLLLPGELDAGLDGRLRRVDGQPPLGAAARHQVARLLQELVEGAAIPEEEGKGGRALINKNPCSEIIEIKGSYSF